MAQKNDKIIVLSQKGKKITVATPEFVGLMNTHKSETHAFMAEALRILNGKCDCDMVQGIRYEHNYPKRDNFGTARLKVRLPEDVCAMFNSSGGGLFMTANNYGDSTAGGQVK